MELYFNSIKDNVKGKRNNKSPVTLFIAVCSEINCLSEAYPNMILPILIIAIKIPHINNQMGISIAGNIFIKDTVTNARSAAVSILDPNSLTLFVFLAIVPSIISLKPQMI